MKRSLLVIALLAACGGSSKNPNTSTSSSDPAGPATPTGTGTPCSQEIAMVCPDGQIDACLATPAGDTHVCVPTPAVANKCTSEGGRCQSKVATNVCKRFEEAAEWGCSTAGEGCCLDN